jgi:16S rRNA (cytosine1402-N4)-methyltransferase
VFGHEPVLLDEVLSLMAPDEGERYVDATAGHGGHARAVARRLGSGGEVVLNDLDEANLRIAERAVRETGAHVRVIHGTYAELPRKLAAATEGGGGFDLLLADLGFASSQVDDASRGMSFRVDAPLDMRLDQSQPVTARELVETLSERELADILWRYGEERMSRAIARKLVAERAVAPIDTTVRLASIVRSAIGQKSGSIDSATRTFQALRIAVNDEIGSLESLLRAIELEARRLAEGAPGGWLRHGARVGVISFHSLEDRPVKRTFAALAEQGLAQVVTRKPVRASEEELARNVRARSAKLRIVRLG